MIAQAHISNHTKAGNWHHYLQQYEQVQITLTNQSTSEQQYRLWGANQGIADFGGSATINTGTYPQAIAFNSSNGYFYVGNQLSGTITVFDSNGALVKEIQLEPEFPGFVSPGSLAVDEGNGNVFVGGLISNLIYVIDNDLEVSGTIEVPSRPYAMTWNQSNSRLYVAHLISHTVSVVDPVQSQVEDTINIGNPISGLLADPRNGDTMILVSGTWQVVTYDQTNQSKGTISNIGEGLAAGVLTETVGELLVLTTEDSTLHLLDIENDSIIQSQAVDGSPTNIIALGDGEGFLLLDTENEVIRRYDQSLQLVDTLEVPELNWGIAYDPTSDVAYITQPLKDSATALALGEQQGPSILLSDNYVNAAYEFQYNPILLKHVRVVFSGDSNAPTFTIGHRTPTGLTRSWKLSLGNRKSPQQRLNLLELHELENEVIDGKTYWMVTLLPLERISLLLYYEQFNRDQAKRDLEKNDKREEKRTSDYEYEEGDIPIRATRVWDQR